MIVIYNGNRPWIKIDQQTQESLFDCGVPTYCPGNLQKIIGDNPDFSIWNGDKTADARSILVYMPVTLEHFISAIPTLERIKKRFPLCPIVVKSDRRFKVLLPSNVSIAISLTKADRQNAYRSYDLSQPKRNIFTDVVLKIRSWEEMFLDQAGLCDVQTDKFLKHVIECDNGNTSGNNLLIIKNDELINRNYEGMADRVSEHYSKSGLNIKCIDKYDVEMLGEQMELIRQADYVISCCDSPLMFIAGCMRKPGFVFVPRNKEYREKQYKMFGLIGAVIQKGQLDIETHFNAVKERTDAVLKDTSVKVHSKPKRKTVKIEQTQTEIRLIEEEKEKNGRISSGKEKKLAKLWKKLENETPAPDIENKIFEITSVTDE